MNSFNKKLTPKDSLKYLGFGCFSVYLIIMIIFGVGLIIANAPTEITASSLFGYLVILPFFATTETFVWLLIPAGVVFLLASHFYKK